MQQRLHLEALLLSRTAELAHSRDVAQAASQAKSMFLANMSHEIRTPMNAILGLSYLALGTPLADETRNYIQKVHNADENLLGIINGILDFSKAEAGKMQLEHPRFVLAEVLNRVMETAGVEAKSKGARAGAASRSAGTHRAAGRCDAARSGVAQPVCQRDQVHREGRGAAAGGAPPRPPPCGDRPPEGEEKHLGRPGVCFS